MKSPFQHLSTSVAALAAFTAIHAMAAHGAEVMPVPMTGEAASGPMHEGHHPSQAADPKTHAQGPHHRGGHAGGALASPAAPASAPVLAMDDAVRLAMARSPAWQARVAQGEAEQARWQQLKWALPLGGSFERSQQGGEREWLSSLRLDLWALLSWPSRIRQADAGQAQSRLEDAKAALAFTTEVKLAWIDALLAQQQWQLAARLLDSAQASAELGRRMQAAGHWPAFSAQAQRWHETQAEQGLQEAQARRAQAWARLGALLGLRPDEAAAWSLPAAWPALPGEAELGASTPVARDWQERLDVRIARARWEQLSAQSSQARWESLFHLGVTRGLSRHASEAGHEVTRGGRTDVELAGLALDGGAGARRGADAQQQAADLQAQATLAQAVWRQQEADALRLQQWRLAVHQRDQVLPLRRQLSDGLLLRYNAMQVGVFELLDDARGQLQSLSTYQSLQAAFWRAQVRWEAESLGLPMGMEAPGSRAADAGVVGAGH